MYDNIIILLAIMVSIGMYLFFAGYSLAMHKDKYFWVNMFLWWIVLPIEIGRRCYNDQINEQGSDNLRKETEGS